MCSSVVNNLIKGPSIATNDKIAIRRFADQATRALAALKSMNCVTEINQGNIASMTERLPRHLQDKFATLAYNLEAKGQRFPTLADFIDFINKHANIANHCANHCALTASGVTNIQQTRAPAPSGAE